MATTEAAPKTRDQVEQLMKEGVTDAKQIAERLGKTPATIYVHIRNIEKAQGTSSPRKRGRPPGSGKTQTPAATETPAQTRPRPGAGKDQPEAKENGQGDHNTLSERFPMIKEAVEAQLAEKRRDVATLEALLERLA